MRYYDADFGRFINRDPIEYESGDVNIYRYLFNFPLVDQDSLGLQLCFDYWEPIETRYKFIAPNKYEITQGRLHIWMTEEKNDCGNIKCVQIHSAWIKIRQFTLTIKPPIDIHPKPPLPPTHQPGKVEGGVILTW
jgi:uncharacterized protein RhaS with RHS repeats